MQKVGKIRAYLSKVPLPFRGPERMEFRKAGKGAAISWSSTIRIEW